MNYGEAIALLGFLRSCPAVVSGASYERPGGGYRVQVYDRRNRAWSWDSYAACWADIPALLATNA